MKNLIGTFLLSLATSGPALTDGVIYHIFVDGLACQRCAAVIDLKMRAIEGAERVEVLTEKGIVNVRMTEGYVPSKEEVAAIFADAGVKFCRMEQHLASSGDQENFS